MWGLAGPRERIEEEAVAPGLSHPDSQAGCAELESAILAAIEKLPIEQRLAFVLHEVQGFSNADIAAIMQCPVNTVRSRRILAVKKLRESLDGVRTSWNGKDLW